MNILLSLQYILELRFFGVCYCLGIDSESAILSESPVESTENMRHKRNAQHLEGFANEPLLDSDSMR